MALITLKETRRKIARTARRPAWGQRIKNGVRARLESLRRREKTSSARG